MKVLLTGATGYLGGRLALALAGAGHDVRALVRDPARWADPPAGAEAVRGDVTDAGALRAAAAGCGAVVHAAALVKVWAKDRSAFDRVNVGGLEHAAAAAREAGARLLVVSSFMALGPTDGAVHDETTPRTPGPAHNDYERTKWAADRRARELSGGQEIVRVYPGVVFGPGALTAGNHVVQALLQHARGKLPGYLGPGDRRQCLAYVDDVSAGVVAALERGRPGEGYILGGENVTVRALFEEFGRLTGIAPPRRSIPYGVAALIGRLQRAWAEVGGREPELTDEVVGIYRREWAYSSARAARELGYRITPFPRALAETVAWLRRTGQLPAGA